jgi:flap endonuclease-1
MAIYQFLIAT